MTLCIYCFLCLENIPSSSPPGPSMVLAFLAHCCSVSRQTIRHPWLIVSIILQQTFISMHHPYDEYNCPPCCHWAWAIWFAVASEDISRHDASNGFLSDFVLFGLVLLHSSNLAQMWAQPTNSENPQLSSQAQLRPAKSQLLTCRTE